MTSMIQPRRRGALRRLLVVEDDEHVAAAMMSVLERHGYHVTSASTGREALDQLTHEIDAVLLDLSLPDMDGFDVCRKIREQYSVPLIMVTARTDVDSRIRGLQLGADDYVTKPYELREVLARIDAVLRRAGADQDDSTPETFEIAGVTIDLAARTVIADEAELPLTRKEFDLLAMLVRQAGVVVRREQILGEVWGSDWHGLERTLEVHVASLRNKLGDHQVIRTVRGIGYRLGDADLASVR